jgi:hypothetical protein
MGVVAFGLEPVTGEFPRVLARSLRVRDGERYGSYAGTVIRPFTLAQVVAHFLQLFLATSRGQELGIDIEFATRTRAPLDHIYALMRVTGIPYPLRRMSSPADSPFRLFGLA